MNNNKIVTKEQPMKQLIQQLIAARDALGDLPFFELHAAALERAERVLIHIDNTPSQPVGNNDARRPLKLIYADELEKLLQ